MLDKNKLFDSLYKSLHNEFILLRTSVNEVVSNKGNKSDSQFDNIVVISFTDNPGIILRISRLDNIPHISMQVNKFIIIFDLDEKPIDIENHNSIFVTRSSNNEKAWARQIYSILIQAFVDGGYKFTRDYNI